MNKTTNLWRNGIAMLLALCMVVGMLPVTAFAVEPAGKETINYVSLGDSMSNGYGLDGYDGNTGVEDYGDGAYANQFAKWLKDEGYSETEVEHTRLAMSAMRAEDLHWLLELDYNDPEAIALTEMKEWDPEAWNAKFTTGDYWTWNELCDDYRFSVAAYAIKNDGYTDDDDDADRKITFEEAKIVAEYYQNAVKNADIISLGMGNGNFGVFMFGRILEAIGFNGKPEDAMRYDIEAALQEVKLYDEQYDADMYNEIKLLISELYKAVEDFTGAPVDDGDPTVTTAMEAMMNTLVYTTISYVLNYAGSVDAILKLNPDADIILVPLMNTFMDEEQAAAGASADLSLGQVMALVFDPLNKFIAGLPTYMQATDKPAYANATFYYAEPDGRIECLVDVFGEDFYKADGTPNENSEIRDRFVESIVGDCACYYDGNGDRVKEWNCETCGSTCADRDYSYCSRTDGMVWGMLSGVELVPDIAVCRITLDDVLAYDGMTDAQKAAYAAGDTRKAVSIAIYLAFEDACIEATKGASVSLESVLGLGGLSMDLFGPVMESFMDNVDTNGAAYATTAYEVVAGIANNLQSQIVMTADYVKIAHTQGEHAAAVAIVKDQMEEQYSETLSGMGLTVDMLISMGEAGQLVDNYAALAPYYQGYLDNVASAEALLEGYGIVGYVDMLCMLLAIPETLSDSLQADPSVSGLLALFARCVIGNGLGGHPSQGGHDTLFRSVRDAYANDYTAQDKTNENLDEIYTEIYNKPENQAKVAELLGYIDAAQAALDAAQAWMAANEALIPAEAMDAWNTLYTEMSQIRADLETAKEALSTSDRQAALAALINLKENLAIHEANIKELAAELGILGELALEDLTAAAEAAAELVKAIADEAYAQISNGAKEFAAEYAAWVEEMGAQADKIDPALGAALRKFLTETPADSLAILYAYGEEAYIKLITDAAVAYGDIYEIVSALAGVLYEHGEGIYETLIASDDYNTIVEQIKALKAELEYQYEYAGKHPVSDVVFFEESIAKLEAALQKAYDELYAIIMRTIEAYDEDVYFMVDTLLDSLFEALGVAGIATSEYGQWLLGHMAAMGCELLNALLANIDELAAVAGPVFGEIIWNTIIAIEEAIPGLLEELYDCLVAALLKALPIVDQWLYDWLYNNPDKVIAFFTEYGDEIWAILEEYGDEALGIILYIAATYGPDVLDYIMNNPEEAFENFMKWYDKYGYRIWPMVDVYLEALGVYDAIDEQLGALADLLDKAGAVTAEELEKLAKELIAKAETALEELKAKLEDALENAADELAEQLKDQIAELEALIAALEATVEAMIEEGVAAAAEKLLAIAEEIKALLNDIYVDATTNKYLVKANSHYTAIGDATAASDSYVDLLAEELGLGNRYTNLAEAGQTITGAYAVVEDNAETIAKSDLITVGYGVNGFNTFVKNQILSGDTMDWATVTGEESVEYIDAALAELKAYFVEQGLDQDIQIPIIGEKNLADTLTLAVEAYAYAYIEYVTNYPEVINAIHEISPEALVIIVGMYNPLEGVVIEGIDLGEYLQYIVAATNAHSLAYAMLTPNTIYVDAPEVQTKKTASEMTVQALVLEMMTGFGNLVPSEAGHEYIKTQIYNALDLTGILGDANSDGIVNNVDAMLVLQYYAGLIGEDDLNLDVCDVDGNGKINNVDAMLILQYYAQIITVFPVEA